MTKRHFQALAKILADLDQRNPTCAAETMRRWIGRELVTFCREQNPLFDEAKFRAAAKLPQE